MKWQDRITINPKIMVGKPVITGTRIPVDLIIKKLAQGETPKEILRDYPRLRSDDIQAALWYTLNLLNGESVYSTQ